MRQLRAEDSAEKHRRAVRAHMGACQRSSNVPLCVALRQEADAVYKALRSKTRELEDAEDDLVDFSAEADAVEEILEAVLRDFFQDLGRLDRENPSLDLQATAFPSGLGEVLEPRGQEQVDAVVGLLHRVKSKQEQPKVAEGAERLSAANVALQAALKAEIQAEEERERIITEEYEARKAVREQLNNAHGQLRSFFKTNPARAERYFIKESGAARRAASSTPSTPKTA